jgi:tripartite-type tricarboxylate transporter receptor subunit TctC
MILKSFLTAALLTAAYLTTAGSASAQDYPNKRVTIVVPFSAGGSTDTVARVLAAKLQAELGQPFIVENKPGASGNIAAEYVARSNPDGYMLFMGTSTSIANLSLFKKLSYDMMKDFVPVSQAVHTPLVLIANNNVPANSIAEFIKHAKESNGKISYGSAGSGTSQHLGGVMFEHLAGVQMLHVPYKGAAPAVTDLIGGQIDIMFAPLVDGLPYIKTGKVKALGLTTPKKNAQVPNVVPISTVLPGFDVATWNGIFAPATTPPKVVAKLSAAIGKIMRQPNTRKTVEEQGSEPIGSTPDEFKKFVANEAVIWRKLVEISGAKAD